MFCARFCELRVVSFWWSANTGVSISRSPENNVVCEIKGLISTRCRSYQLFFSSSSGFYNIFFLSVPVLLLFRFAMFTPPRYWNVTLGQFFVRVTHRKLVSWGSGTKIANVSFFYRGVSDVVEGAAGVADINITKAPIIDTWRNR